MQADNTMADRGFYTACPKCMEPDTEIKYGPHVSIVATVTKYGGGSRMAFKCTVCGAIEEMNIVQMSFSDFDDYIKTKTNNSEDDKNASR